MSVFSRGASQSSPTHKLLLVSHDVRFRCLMAQTQLLAQERDLVGAQARFAEGVKLAKAQAKAKRSPQARWTACANEKGKQSLSR